MFIIKIVGGVINAVLGLVAYVLRPFGITIAARRGEPTDCDDAGQTPGCGSNPRICGTSQAIVYGPTGQLAEYTQCEPGSGPRTFVRGQTGHVGLDAAARAELRFSPTPAVTVDVVHFSNPGRVEVFQGPTLIDMRMMAAGAGTLEHFQFNGTGINRIVVTPASPNDITLVIGWCH